MNKGWWKLDASMFDDSELNDNDREHIAHRIKEGYTEGELIHEEDDDA